MVATKPPAISPHEQLEHDLLRRSQQGTRRTTAAAFLPSLAPGQALLLGVDYPIPLIVAVTPPGAKPDSRGPDFQTHWRRRTREDQEAGVSTEAV